MHPTAPRRRTLAIGAAFVLLAASLLAARLASTNSSASAARLSPAVKELQASSPGNAENAGESAEAHQAQQQFDNARLAPNGVVAAGAYSAACGDLTKLDPSGSAWQEVTNVPYDADDADYRDYYSNSSGGSGLVTGRITGLAADGGGHVYAAGADGGVWRSSTGGGKWTPIADALPSLSSGDLELGPDNALWYATGEANTGGTSYAGTGVYRLANPASGVFTPADRVGGTELESTTINSLRFAGGKVWAATVRGIWWHTLGDNSSPWHLGFAPNPSFLPGGADAGVQNAAYKNIVNDLVVDPRNANHLLAALGWRSGDTYNGFYESTDGGATWTKVNLKGGLDATDIGYANFAYSADGKKLYAINQSPRRLSSGSAQQQTYLDGVYVSSTGSLNGPWTRIASSDKLGATATGYALSKHDGRGYSTGIQAWYNQFIAVDPTDANNLYVGLEVVYEHKDGCYTLKNVGMYWNF